jgi:hypothetical protein
MSFMSRRKHVSVKKLSVQKRSLKVVAKKEGLSGFVDFKIESNLCPFDGLSCAMVGSCDDVLSLAIGSDCVEGCSCSRAVVKAHR